MEETFNVGQTVWMKEPRTIEKINFSDAGPLKIFDYAVCDWFAKSKVRAKT